MQNIIIFLLVFLSSCFFNTQYQKFGRERIVYTSDNVLVSFYDTKGYPFYITFEKDESKIDKKYFINLYTKSDLFLDSHEENPMLKIILDNQIFELKSVFSNVKEGEIYSYIVDSSTSSNNSYVKRKLKYEIDFEIIRKMTSCKSIDIVFYGKKIVHGYINVIYKSAIKDFIIASST